MPKVLLLTFDAESRDPRRKAFEEAGFVVETEEPVWPASLQAAKRFAPDVIAVDCGQLPSHCRETAEALRANAATSGVPLVLFRVSEHDLERTRLKVPGGVVAFDYELLDRIRSAALTRLAALAALEPAPEAPRPRPVPAPAPAPAVAVASSPVPRPPPAPAASARPARARNGDASATAAGAKTGARTAPVRKAPRPAGAARSAKVAPKPTPKKATARKKH